MKLKISTRLILYVILLLTGMLAGIVIQKYLGLGNILRAAGIPYPTAAAPMPIMAQAGDIPQVYHGRMRLFILAGQSNMVGFAPIPEGEKTDPRIYVFGKDYRWRLADHPIENASNQVDMVSENRFAGFGPAMDFAFASLERHPDIVIGLIPCAKTSSGISQWQRDLSDQSLYGSCLKRAFAASPMGEISGILFFQGETDALDPLLYPEYQPHPAEWGTMFSAFVTNLRKDLNQPGLPVVYAQIGPNTDPDAFPYWGLVQEQQASLSLSEVSMITTDDLLLMDDLHFTADSYQIIGKRFADVFWELVEQNPGQ